MSQHCIPFDFSSEHLLKGFQCRLTAPSIDILLNHPPFCSPVSPRLTLSPMQVLYSAKRSKISKPVIHIREHNLHFILLETEALRCLYLCLIPFMVIVFIALFSTIGQIHGLFIQLSFASHQPWHGSILDTLTFWGCFKLAVKDYGAG